MMKAFLLELKMKGFKQADIAKIAGVSSSHISQLANGGKPSVDVIINLANYFKVSIDHILGRGYNRKEKPEERGSSTQSAGHRH